jgi:hypothetical protein
LFQGILCFALIKHETSHKAIERLIKLLKDYTSIKSVTKSVKHKMIARFVVVQPFLNWLIVAQCLQSADLFTILVLSEYKSVSIHKN